MLWLLNVGLMRRIVEHCKITEELFWLFCPFIEVVVFPFFLTFLMFLVADRHDEKHFFSFFLPGGWSGFYIFHLFLTFIILSVADRQELFLLFIPAACGRIIVTGQRKTVRIFLYFSFLSLFLRFYFHLIKCLAYKTIRFHRIDRNWPYNESFKIKFVKLNV